MPTEVGQVHPKRETYLEEVLLRIDLVFFTIDMDRRHSLPPRAPLPGDVPLEVLSEIPHGALQGFDRSRGQSTKGVTRPEELGVSFE